MTARLARLPTVFGLLVWLALWELVGRSSDLLLLPPFSSVLRAFGLLLEDPAFLAAAGQSLLSFALGYALAVAAGIATGVAMARLRALDQVLGVWVDIALATPLTALVPALMAIFGLGGGTVIATVFLFSVWIVVLDTRAGVREADQSLIDMARGFGAGRRAVLWQVVLPAALPEILVGLRLGAIAGVKGVVVGQLLIAVFGIGGQLAVYANSFLMDRFWAVMLLVLAFAYSLVMAIQGLERRVAHYAPRR